MPIEANCPKCGKKYRLSSDFQGKKVSCKECGHAFRLGKLAAEEPVQMDTDDMLLPASTTQSPLRSPVRSNPSPSQPAAPDFRTWKSSEGDYSVEARLIKTTASMVTLRKKNGDEIEVPLDKLSTKDERHARSFTQPASQANNSGVRRCIRCKGVLHAGARVCPHCRLWQDPKEYATTFFSIWIILMIVSCGIGFLAFVILLIIMVWAGIGGFVFFDAMTP